MPVLVEALRRHANHDGVLHWGTTAMLRLTHDSPERTQAALDAGAREVLATAAALPSTRELPTVAAKVELAHKWLAMHADTQRASPKREGAADGGRHEKLFSKAERVFKELVYDAALGFGDRAAEGEQATGMAHRSVVA